MTDSASVRVPATSANIGPGFDCLGLALDLWGTITLEQRAQDASTDDPMASMAISAARRVFDKIGRKSGDLRASYSGIIPIARGLGASAVARVGGLIAANELAGKPLDRDELLVLGTDLEGHADNVAPAIFGGLQVSVVEGDRVLHTAAPLPMGLQAVLFVPEFRIATKDARRVLPESLSRADVVHNTARAALLVAAMARGRFDLLNAATQDKLHQPARSTLFPAMTAIFEAAREAGAHAVYLSGSGSTLCAFATANTQGIADAMLEAARAREVPGQTITTKPTETGAEVMP
ncbi:MAG: homoserine kinase [Chloroflexota bacterium]